MAKDEDVTEAEREAADILFALRRESVAGLGNSCGWTREGVDERGEFRVRGDADTLHRLYERFKNVTVPSPRRAGVVLSDGSVARLDEVWSRSPSSDGSRGLTLAATWVQLVRETDTGADFDALKAFAASPNASSAEEPARIGDDTELLDWLQSAGESVVFSEFTHEWCVGCEDYKPTLREAIRAARLARGGRDAY